MRIGLAVLVIFAACGRLGFDSLDRSGDGGGDTTVDANQGITLYLVNAGATGPATLYTLDVMTGQATPLGTISPTLITGITRIDANTFIATSYDTPELREITLSPFASQVVDTIPTGSVGIARYTASSFIVANENDEHMYEIVDGSPRQVMDLGSVLDIDTLTPININGGGVTTENGTTYLFTNGVRGLYRVNGNTLDPELMMTTGISSYVLGIAFLNGTLWALSRETDEVFAIDIPTGMVTNRKPICVACPTVLDITNADLVR